MTPLAAFLVAGAAVLAAMSLLWLLSLPLKNSSIADPFWGMAFILANSIYYIFLPAGALPRKMLASVLIILWGLRLSLHLARRYIRSGEDFRYARWRAQHGNAWPLRSYFQVFLLQGILVWLISAPLLAAHSGRAPSTLTWLDLFGAAVWLAGFYFEAAGDWQLYRFKADPANQGKLFTGGVWRYTRHPNYFGDAAQWWGPYLIALAAGGWWTIFSPALMTFLLVRVSGVAMLEKSLIKDKPEYAAYTARTSAFFPRLPRAEKREG
jgi:steroid 5-alpha reductase family enzyme